MSISSQPTKAISTFIYAMALKLRRCERNREKAKKGNGEKEGKGVKGEETHKKTTRVSWE